MEFGFVLANEQKDRYMINIGKIQNKSLTTKRVSNNLQKIVTDDADYEQVWEKEIDENWIYEQVFECFEAFNIAILISVNVITNVYQT